MKFILIISTLLLGLCEAAKRTTSIASEERQGTLDERQGFLSGRQRIVARRQTTHGDHPQESAWDLIELQKLDNAGDAWNKTPTSPTNDTEVEDSSSLSPRQNYPTLPGPGDTNELPGPISTTRRPIPPYNPPPGCYAIRGQFPSPNNCANYLNCWDGVVIEQTCPDGLLFNDQTLVCDYSYNVNCGSRPLPTPKPSLPIGSKLCPEPNGRYRSATNCSEFYVCVYRKPILFSCPRGLVYNDILGVCDYLYNVDCKGAATPRPPPITISPITQPPPPQPTYAPPPYGPSQPPSDTPAPPSLPPPYGPSYPSNPWGSRIPSEVDPWRQRPASTQLDLEKQEEETLFSDQSQVPEAMQNPWNLIQNIPAGLSSVPCENGKIHRLNDSCTNVVVCRNGRPQLVQCSTGLAYDRPSDSCKPISIAKC